MMCRESENAKKKKKNCQLISKSVLKVKQFRLQIFFFFEGGGGGNGERESNGERSRFQNRITKLNHSVAKFFTFLPYSIQSFLFLLLGQGNRFCARGIGRGERDEGEKRSDGEKKIFLLDFYFCFAFSFRCCFNFVNFFIAS